MILFPNCTADESPCYPLRYSSVCVREVEGENDLGVAVCEVSQPMAAAPVARVIKSLPAGCLRFFMFRSSNLSLIKANRGNFGGLQDKIADRSQYPTLTKMSSPHSNEQEKCFSLGSTLSLRLEHGCAGWKSEVTVINLIQPVTFSPVMEVLRPLETIQNRCLRAISGAYRATPIQLLESETGIPPLRSHLNIPQAQYQLRKPDTPIVELM